MPQFVRAAATSEIQPGSVKSVTIQDKTIALCNAGGTFYALDNVCLHRGGPLGDGCLNGETLMCPWHGWRFDVKTGCVAGNCEMKVASYEVKVEGSDVLVAL
jgi:nitrite reductase/ring-hydroxylating ferredoxin subunit